MPDTVKLKGEPPGGRRPVVAVCLPRPAMAKLRDLAEGRGVKPGTLALWMILSALEVDLPVSIKAGPTAEPPVGSPSRPALPFEEDGL